MGKLHAIKEVLRTQVKHSHARGASRDARCNGHLARKPFICKAFSVIPLEDGIYDAIIVDVDDADEDDVVRLDLTITMGQHKGEVVSVRAEHLGVDALSLLAMPARLVVREGVP